MKIHIHTSNGLAEYIDVPGDVWDAYHIQFNKEVIYDAMYKIKSNGRMLVDSNVNDLFRVWLLDNYRYKS